MGIEINSRESRPGWKRYFGSNPLVELVNFAEPAELYSLANKDRRSPVIPLPRRCEGDHSVKIQVSLLPTTPKSTSSGRQSLEGRRKYSGVSRLRLRPNQADECLEDSAEITAIYLRLTAGKTREGMREERVAR